MITFQHIKKSTLILNDIFTIFFEIYYNANEKYETSFHYKFSGNCICVKSNYEKFIYINKTKFQSISNDDIGKFYSLCSSKVQNISLNYIVGNVNSYDRIVEKMLGTTDEVKMQEYKLLLAGVYKIHLMPKKEYFMNVMNRIFQLLDKNMIEIYGMKCLYDTIDEIYDSLNLKSHDGYYPIITLYCNYGRQNAYNTLLQLINEFHDHANIGLGLKPRLNSCVNTLIYFKQGHTDSKIPHDISEYIITIPGTNDKIMPQANPTSKHQNFISMKKNEYFGEISIKSHINNLSMSSKQSMFWEDVHEPKSPEYFADQNFNDVVPSDIENSQSISDLIDCHSVGWL